MSQNKQIHFIDPDEDDLLDLGEFDELDEDGQGEEEDHLVLKEFDDDDLDLDEELTLLELPQEQPPAGRRTIGPALEEDEDREEESPSAQLGSRPQVQEPFPDEENYEDYEDGEPGRQKPVTVRALAWMIRKFHFNEGKPLPEIPEEDEPLTYVGRKEPPSEAEALELEPEAEEVDEEGTEEPSASDLPQLEEDGGNEEDFPDLEQAMEEGTIASLPEEGEELTEEKPAQPRKKKNPIAAIQQKTADYSDRLFVGDQQIQGTDLTSEEQEEARQEELRRRRLKGPVPIEELDEHYTDVDDVEYEEAEEETAERRSLFHRQPREKKEPTPKADIHPRKLAILYDQGIKVRRGRVKWALVVTILIAYVNLSSSFGLPVPSFLWEDGPCAGLMLELMGIVALLLLESLLGGLKAIFNGQMGFSAMSCLAFVFTAADSVFYLLVGREGPLPCAAAAALSLTCTAWGELSKLQAMRQSCKTAAVTEEPIRLEREQELRLDGKYTLRSHRGTLEGFGSRIQADDGIQRMTRPLSFLLVAGGVALALVASVGKGAPDRMLWSASIIFTVSAPLAGTLAYGLPFRRIAARLSSSNAVLAGWSGAEQLQQCGNVVLQDNDLFPTGMAKLNGFKAYNDTPVELAVGFAATLIRAGESGLDKAFYDLVQRQQANYWELTDFQICEGGGYMGVIQDHEVLVGSSSFMVAMGIPLDPGISVKDAVFCVIDGELSAVFAIAYQMPNYVRPALVRLIRAKLVPTLATRDFNITPELLRQKFSLPVDQMEFPDVDRRLELSTHPEEKLPLAALVCKEGLFAHMEAVVGGRRLCRTVRRSGKITIVAAVLGMILGFYLTFVGAYASLAPENILGFLLLWLIPVLVMSRNVDRY